MKKVARYWLGKKLSPEHRKKLSEAHLGKVLSVEKREQRKQKIRLANSGKKVYCWKGDNVGYRGLHHWVKRWKGSPKKCEFCGVEKTTPKSIHWANVDNKYRRKLEDFIALCAKCHIAYDKSLRGA